MLDLRVLRLLIAVAASACWIVSTGSSREARPCEVRDGAGKDTTATVLPAFATTLCAQPPARIATTPEALTVAAVFFHGKQVVIRRGTIESNGLVRLAGTVKPIFVIWKDRGTGGIESEVRGEFWDIGRIQRDDSRFSSVDFKPILEAAYRGDWPPRDQVFVLLNAAAVESPLPSEATIRAVALAPEHYKDRPVTVVGRFRGANLFGDLPLPVAKSRWDFVVQSADGALWVTGMRPRGKGFDLDPGTRIDTGRWLQVTGTLRFDGPLPWLEATAIATTTAPTETPVDVIVPTTPREVSPEVVFSAPIAGETDADRTGPIRIQFSRDMDARSFRDRVHISYTGNAPQGTATAPPAFTYKYDEGSRALEIKLAVPLDRYRQVRIDLADGIVSAVDNQPLAPWSLTFTTGG